MAPQGTAGWRNGVPIPGPGRGQGPSQSSLNTAMRGSPRQTLSRVPCHFVGPRAKPRTGAPTPRLTGAPEPKLTGEALLGLVDSQVWASQRMAGWRKGAPSPGPGQGPARAPELAGKASLGRVDSQAWAPQSTAGWRKGVPAPGPGRGLDGAPEPRLAGETSPGLVDSQVWAPQGMAGCSKGVPALPRAQQGVGAQLKLSEHSHAWESTSEHGPGALPPGGPEDKAQDRGSQPGACQGLWTQTDRGILAWPGELTGLGPSGYGRLQEGSACPRAQWGP
ncbi:hypothetical protein NDU88_006776 [Pleurodeles waltl]|uniref:Uncharacterized protein n=1 Tax=Pleurodeles waltl TaxID=8319 RepID=A0AAV7NUF6_PLEWA|nr:hypothetical protein NDU88_006776 [Pleurodeles waltl]